MLYEVITVNQHIGTTSTGTDGSAVFMDLWEPEYLYIEIQDGEVVKAAWKNPSDITHIDNENVQTKSWEEIKDIFIDQMEYLLSPETDSKKTEVFINRIELGLTKILMKNSTDDYKLIPTWSFSGYDQDTNPESEKVGAPICFITINAIDGSVIDRGLMYYRITSYNVCYTKLLRFQLYLEITVP